MSWRRPFAAAPVPPHGAIPAIGLDELVQRYAAGFGRVRAAGDWSDPVFRQQAGPILLGFARRVHLLPLCAGQHAGSMLEEGLARCAENLLGETGRYPPRRWAGEAAPAFDASRLPTRDRDRWQCLVLLHALAPLTAAAASSMKVTIGQACEIDLFDRPLSDLLAEGRSTRYGEACGSEMGYRVAPAAGNEVHALGAVLLLRTLPAYVLRHLTTPDAGWLAWACGLCDQGASPRERTKPAGGANPPAVEGAARRIEPAMQPLASRIDRSMLALIAQGRWAVNRKRARLWHLDGSLFLVWKTAAVELLALLEEDAGDPHSLMQTMIAAGIIACESDGGALRTITTPYTAMLEVVELTDAGRWLQLAPSPVSVSATRSATVAPVPVTSAAHGPAFQHPVAQSDEPLRQGVMR